MRKLTLGHVALAMVGLGLGLVIATFPLLLDAHHKHQPAPVAIVVFLLALASFVLGLVLCGVHVIRRAFVTSGSRLTGVAACFLVPGLMATAALELFHLWGGPVAPWLAISALALVAVGLALRVVDRGHI